MTTRPFLPAAVVRLLLTVGVPAVEPEDALAYRLSTLKKLDRQAASLGGETLLAAAAREGHESVVVVLFADTDVNPTSQDSSGRTPLSWASIQEHVTVVQALLSHNSIDADHKDQHGYAPLASAAVNGHAEVVILLLAHTGVD